MRTGMRIGLGFILIALILATLGAFAAPYAAAQEGPMSGPTGVVDRLIDRAQGECPAEPPTVQEPRRGLAGTFMGEPEAPYGEGKWSTRGVAGLESFTYDLGCVTTPGDALSTYDAKLDTGVANRFVQIGLLLTAAADFLDRLSWDPAWITTFLGDLSTAVVDAVSAAVFLPYIALGLVLTTVVLLFRARTGRISLVAMGTAWAGFVIVIAVLILSSPLFLSTFTQQQSGNVVTALYGGINPATAATERTVEAVHYQGLLRRTFGTDPSPLAVDAMPAIYESVGYTYAEREADRTQRVVIWAEKMNRLNEVTGELKEADPEAYRGLQGLDATRTNQAALELGYSAAANGFRIFAALLRIACIFALVLLGFVWLCAAPYLVAPQGEGTGRNLLNNSFRAIGYVLVSILASFGFGLWSYFSMAPTVPTAMSVVLLVIGTALFWSMTRPDRKLLSLVSGGKVTGFGSTQRWLLDKLGTFAAVRLATEHLDEPDRETHSRPVSSEEYTSPVFDAHIVPPTPGPALPGPSHIVDGQAWEVYDVPAADIQYGEVEVYQRS